MRYDLTGLGTREFEHLSQALAVAILGNTVQVFGDGPDGGREATFDGRMNFSGPDPDGALWDGYGVVQAKFKQSSAGTTQDTSWLIQELRRELRTWEDQKSGRRERGRLPHYLIVTTNVTLSPDPGRGGIDQVASLMNTFSGKLKLRGWAVWHRDQICAYLDVHESVRTTYAGFITTGDVLTRLHDVLHRLRPDEIHDEPLEDLLTRRAAKELSAQQWVRLSEAGHRQNAKLKLSEVAIDLPARPIDGGPGEQIPGTVAYVVEAGDVIRRPRPGIPALPHIALLGGPGQGKTTLGQLICQAYRVAILEQRPQHTLGVEIPDVITAYRRHLDALRLPTPRCRRWPVRVVLSEFADAIAEAPQTTLLGYIAAQTRDVSPINPRMMREWLRAWPWVLVLDGLDEVADPENREKALQAFSEFYVDAGQVEADLLIVATTRPQGYQDELPSKIYEHLSLDRMQAANTIEYSEHLTKVRFADDVEMHDRVLARLRAAAADPQTARLMSTPLQVTIMSILLERRATAPRDRHALFQAYYDTLYDRETGKGTPIARLLEDHRADIDYLHERVGWLLQTRAQHAGEAEAHLPLEQLRQVVVARLIEEGYSEDRAGELAGTLAKAATDRLVMLVGSARGTVGFEVRSLQELMAARSLFAGTDDQIIVGLRALAPSAHWRNTWLFAVSRLFTEREALRAEMTMTLEELDAETPLATYLLPGARLATEMLDEDIAARHPRFRKLLLIQALRLIRTSYPGASMTALARAVHEVVSQDMTLTHIVTAEVLPRLTGPTRQMVAALDFLAAWAALPGDASIAARNRLDPLLRGTPRPELEQALASLGAAGVRDVWRDGTGWRRVEAPPPAPTTRARPTDDYERKAQQALKALERTGRPIPELSDPAVQARIVEILSSLDETDWQQASEQEQRLIHWLSRQPISLGADGRAQEHP